MQKHSDRDTYRKLCQTLKEQMALILQQLFQKAENVRMLFPGS